MDGSDDRCSRRLANFMSQQNLFALLSARSVGGSPRRRGPLACPSPEEIWKSPTLLSRFALRQRLEGHGGCVNTLSFNEDGTLLISGSDDCRLCIWRCWGEEARLLSAVSTGHRRNIFCARFRPGSGDSVAATCALDRQVRLVDLGRGGHSTLLTTFGQFASKLEFLPSAPGAFVTAGQDGCVTLFDVRENGRGRGTALVDLSNVGGCTTLAFDPTAGGHIFAVGCDDPLMRLYDIRFLAAGGKFGRLVGAPEADERGSPCRSTAPLMAFVPPQMRPAASSSHRRHRMADGPSGLAYSSTGQLLVNMRGAEIYLFDTQRGASDTLEADPAWAPPPPPGHSSNSGSDAEPEQEQEQEQAGAAGLFGAPELPLCTSVVREYHGRVNEETFAKEACFVHHDNYVASGGDCGRLFLIIITSP